MTDPALSKIPVNPMHKEFMLSVADLVDKYKTEGMPIDSIVGVICTLAGVVIQHDVHPLCHSNALECCKRNIIEGMKK